MPSGTPGNSGNRGVAGVAEGACQADPKCSSWFFFSSRRRHTRCLSDWSSDVCSSDLSCTDCALYCGWYSLANYVDCCRFVPGAVAYHIASAEAVTLRNPQTKQWCKNLLDQIGRASCRERV